MFYQDAISQNELTRAETVIYQLMLQFNNGMKQVASHWLTSYSFFYDLTGYHSNGITC